VGQAAPPAPLPAPLDQSSPLDKADLGDHQPAALPGHPVWLKSGWFRVKPCFQWLGMRGISERTGWSQDCSMASGERQPPTDDLVALEVAEHGNQSSDDNWHRLDG
jgi:hypothetical protein